MLAAGSVCAAANGVLDFQRCSQLRLLQRLQLITHVDAVSRRASLNVAKLSSASYCLLGTLSGFHEMRQANVIEL